jgi:hypothetical protein
MERRRQEELEQEFKAIEQGWCLGGEAFRKELLEQVSVRPGPSHFGPAVQEAAQVQAERLTVAALKRIGWTEQDVQRRRKGDPQKMVKHWGHITLGSHWGHISTIDNC